MHCHRYLWVCAQVDWNGVFESLGLDWHKQAIDLGAPQACRINQQDHIGRRCRALGLETGQNSRIVSVHTVNLDASCFREITVERFICWVMAC